MLCGQLTATIKQQSKMTVKPTRNEVLVEPLGCHASGDQQDDQGVPSSVPEPGATGPASAALPPTDTDTCSHHQQKQDDGDCGLPSAAQHQDEKDTAELRSSSEPSLETERVAELLVEAEMVVAEHLLDTDDTNKEDVRPEIENPAVNENENVSNDDINTSTDGHYRSPDNVNSNESETDPQEATAMLHVPPPPQSPTTLPAVVADEAQTDAVIEEKDEKQDDAPTTVVDMATAACYPSVADVLLKGRDCNVDGDGDDEEEKEK